MKPFVLFLAFVVFTLTITPCCASDRYESQEREDAQKEKHQQSDDCSKEGCSPFYLCGTCIGFTFMTQRVAVFIIPLTPVKHNTAYIPFELPLIRLAVWQPPRLS